MVSSLASLSQDLLKKILPEKPWGEQAAPGADSHQLPDVVLSDPIDLYRSVRSTWSKQSKLHHPFGFSFQPIQALLHLIEPKNGPLPISQLPSGGAICDTGHFWKEGRAPLLPELCQLSLLWALNGRLDESKKLAHWLIPLLPFKTLWCREKRWDPVEFALSAHLLSSYYRLPFSWIPKELPVQSIDPFFLELERRIQTLPKPLSPIKNRGDEELGVSLFEEGDISWALTLTGQKTTLGALNLGSIEIRAFGPQGYPLTKMDDFGIEGIHKGALQDGVLRGWTKAASSEIWIEVKGSKSRLDLNFVGLHPDKKMAFVFYVKSETAQIGSDLFHPKSLQRYNGSIVPISFKRGSDSLKIESSLRGKVELIPLAGEGCYWETDFLLAYELSPFQSAISFHFLPS